MADRDLTRALTPRVEAFLGFLDLEPPEPPSVADDGSAVVDIMGVIGFHIEASEFVPMLRAVDATRLIVNVDSAGGNVWDGVAIANALRTHPATVEINVLGMAASAASVVAMGGDTVTMHPGSMMMTHNARATADGATAEDCRALAVLLDKINVNMADVYAAKAGGTQAEWLTTMAAETWFTGEEAITAGLADTLAGDDPDMESELSANAMDLRAVFGYKYNGRTDAPDPAPVTETDPTGIELTAEQVAGLAALLDTTTTVASGPVATPAPAPDPAELAAALTQPSTPDPAAFAAAVTNERA